MTKIGITRLVKNLKGTPLTAEEILRRFPKHRWKAMRIEIKELVRSNELKPKKIRGKRYYTSGGDNKDFR